MNLAQLDAQLRPYRYTIGRWHNPNRYPKRGLLTHDQLIIYDDHHRPLAYIDEMTVGKLLFKKQLTDRVINLLEQYATQPLSQRINQQTVRLRLPKRDINLLKRMSLPLSHPDGLNSLELSVNEICSLHHLYRAMKDSKRRGDVIDH